MTTVFTLNWNLTRPTKQIRTVAHYRKFYLLLFKDQYLRRKKLRLSNKKKVLELVNHFPITPPVSGRSVVVVRLFAHLWNILCVNTVYWIAHVLLCRYNEREGEHAGGGHAVVESEHPAVDVNVRDVEQATQLPENFQHDSPLIRVKITERNIQPEMEHSADINFQNFHSFTSAGEDP